MHTHQTQISHSDPIIQRGIRQLWLFVWVTFAFLLVFTEILPWGHELDMLVSNAFYDSNVGRFVFDHDTSWVEVVLHDWFKNALLIIPVYALIQVGFGFWLKRKQGLSGFQAQVWRRWCGALLAALACMLLIVYLKKWTNQACPWSLQDFGGKWPYSELLKSKPWGSADMQCWPAGHASGGFILLSFAFVGGWQANMWDARLESGLVDMPSWLSAKSFVVYAIVLGMILGLGRVSQGAHFFSHQFWALWWVFFANMVFVKLGLIKSSWLEPLFAKSR